MPLQILTALDKAQTQWYHFTTIVIAGMGFFTGNVFFCFLFFKLLFCFLEFQVGNSLCGNNDFLMLFVSYVDGIGGIDSSGP